MSSWMSQGLVFWLAAANAGMLLVLLLLALHNAEHVRSRTSDPRRTPAQRAALSRSLIALTLWLLSYVAKSAREAMEPTAPMLLQVAPPILDMCVAFAWWRAGEALLHATGREMRVEHRTWLTLGALSTALDVWLVLHGSPQHASGLPAVWVWCVISGTPGALALDQLGRGLVAMADTSRLQIHLRSVGNLIRIYGASQVPVLLLRESAKDQEWVALMLAGSVLTVKALIGAGLIVAVRGARYHDQIVQERQAIVDSARAAVDAAKSWDGVRAALLMALGRLGRLGLWIPRRTAHGPHLHEIGADGEIVGACPREAFDGSSRFAERIEIPGLGGASGPAWVTSEASLTAAERAAVTSIGHAVAVRATGLERDRTGRMLAVFPKLREAAEAEDWGCVAGLLREVLGVDVVVLALREAGEPLAAKPVGAAPFAVEALDGLVWGRGTYEQAATAKILETGERKIIDDLDAADVNHDAVRALRAAAQAAGVSRNLKSWAGIPMTVGDEVGAVLSLFNRSTHDARLPSEVLSPHFVTMAEEVIAVLGTLLSMREARLAMQRKADEAERARAEAQLAREDAEAEALRARVAREEAVFLAERARRAEERETEQKRIAQEQREAAVCGAEQARKALAEAKRVEAEAQAMRVEAERAAQEAQAAREQAERAAAEALAARRQAESAEALAASAREDRSRVLATLAHELRSPMNTVRTLTRKLLKDATGLSRRPLDLQRLPRDLEIVLGEASKFEELFQNWRRVTDVVFHGRQAQTREVDLGVCLHRAFGEDLRMEVIARRIKVEMPETSMAVRADAILVERCLANLLSNAVKYGADHAGDTIRVSLEAVPSGVAVHVDDCGDGVAHHERKEIFKAFYRSLRHRSGVPIPGTGLGLYLVRQASLAMDGAVDVRNHKEMPGRPYGDRGARFTLTLPRWTP